MISAEEVTYALSLDEAHPSGDVVSVKNEAGTEVATLTFGEDGGADFKAAKKSVIADTPFNYYTEGNGTNGNSEGGTFYTIKPAYSGNVTIGVVLNNNKAFYVFEDGTALDEYNGITVETKYTGTYSFAVKAGSSYKFYCAGSKLGFHGFF